MKVCSTAGCLAALLLLAGCGEKHNGPKAANSQFTQSPEAVKFLKWSMNRYAALKSFRADEKWSLTTSDSQSLSEVREISYESPNRFRILAAVSNGRKLGSISDGKSLVEFVGGLSGFARRFSAPDSISAISTPGMGNITHTGSMLYQFFGGSDNFDALVDAASGNVEFGPDIKSASGEDCKTVKFYASGDFGHSVVTIGTKTGNVYSITFDADGLRQKLSNDPKAKGSAPELSGTETFSSVVADQALPASVFTASAPAGLKIEDVKDPSSDPPVPIGQTAPDAEFTGLDGKKVRISSLRGKVVLIDFWATWCPPCREGLPITNRIYDKLRSRGLQVVTSSSEDRDTVTAFINQNKYTFPAYVDPDGKAALAYHIDGIPCTVVIDSKGNLTAFLVGLHSETRLLAELKKAGVGG